MTIEFDVSSRYALLCRASQSAVEHDLNHIAIQEKLKELYVLSQQELPALARMGSPDNFADILRDIGMELERFREFCEFPSLAQRVVVAIGGAFSAGKSSLINAILGKRRLAAEVDPTTSLPTYLLQDMRDEITALNLFQRRVNISQDEFLSLTHEELPNYGSQVGGLLRSAFISDPDFPWANIALLDTPGYSKPDSEEWNIRTDEQVARAQLNSAQFIIWVVAIDNGTISEDDLKFLASLRQDIPRLVVLSRADKKTPDDVGKIISTVRELMAQRFMPCLDVVAVSARKKKDFPIESVVGFLEQWNLAPRELTFVQNFKRSFSEYARYIEKEYIKHEEDLKSLNRILSLADDNEICKEVQGLKVNLVSSFNTLRVVREKFEMLQEDFFKAFNSLAGVLGFQVEQLGCLVTEIDDPQCLPEHLIRYADVADKSEMLKILSHPNCPQQVLNRILDSSSHVAVDNDLLAAAVMNRNTPTNEVIRYVDKLSAVDKRKLAILPGLPKEIQLSLAQSGDAYVSHGLAMSPGTCSEAISVLSSIDNFHIRLALAVHQNSDAPVQLKLISRGESDVISLLAASSNCTPEAQIKLAEEKLEISVLLDNPRLCDDAQVTIVKNVDIDDNWTTDKRLGRLAKHPNIGPNAQAALIRHYGNNYSWEMEGLALNPNCTPTTQEWLAKFGGKSGWESNYREQLAKNPSLTHEVQKYLIGLGVLNEGCKNALAANQSCCEEVQLEIVDNDYDGLDQQVILAKNPSCTKIMQIRLAKSDETKVRQALATNEKCAVEAQEILVTDENRIVRFLLSRNPSLERSISQRIRELDPLLFTANAIEDLVFVEGFSWSYGAILRVDTPLTAEAQLKMIKHGVGLVALAERQDCIDEAQEKIARLDSESWPEQYAVRNLAMNPSCTIAAQMILAEGIDERFTRMPLAENRACFPQVQEKLANDSKREVRKLLASNPSTIESVLLKLADDDDENVREAVAKNPSCTQSLLFKLAQDSNWQVYRAVAENESIGDSTWPELMKHGKDVYHSLAGNRYCPELVQLTIARSNKTYDRKALASNIGVFFACQEILSNDNNVEILAALIQNPSCDEGFREKMIRSAAG